MTDRLKEAVKLAEEEQIVPISDELIVDWLDDKVETLKKIIKIIRSSPESLYMGKLDTFLGRYEVQIETCGFYEYNLRDAQNLHIYAGIERLAKAVNAKIRREDFGDKGNSDCYFFFYKDIKIFELCNKGENPR